MCSDFQYRKRMNMRVRMGTSMPTGFTVLNVLAARSLGSPLSFTSYTHEAPRAKMRSRSNMGRHHPKPSPEAPREGVPSSVTQSLTKTRLTLASPAVTSESRLCLGSDLRDLLSERPGCLFPCLCPISGFPSIPPFPETPPLPKKGAGALHPLDPAHLGT